MDRFLNISQTLLLDGNQSYSRSFASKSFTGQKSTPKQQLSLRKSICDDRLIQLLSSKPDEPLNSTQTKFTENPKIPFCDENLPPEADVDNAKFVATSKRHPVGKSVEEKVSGEFDVQQKKSMTTLKTNEGSEKPKCNFKINNPALKRLKRDLNSPSANARMRAIKALKSPTGRTYNHFDIPHEEQDIITEEEKNQPIQPKSIQDVLKNVIVYVEVRTGEDNRTAGVKKVISQLGAKVKDKLVRETTHVVFKDGLQSTYNKAKKWNIPIVSILWIEECRKNKRLMDPKLFPISNEYQYDNPELYKKIKRQKSMQPDAEDRIKGKVKPKTDLKNTIKSNLAPRIPKKPQDKLNDILNEFHTKIMNTPEDSELPMNSKLLDLIRNSPYKTPNLHKKKNKDDTMDNFEHLDSISNNTASDCDDFENLQNVKTPKVNAKKTLFKEINKRRTISSTSTLKGEQKTTRNRRNSVQVISSSEESFSSKSSSSQKRRSSISSFSNTDKGCDTVNISALPNNLAETKQVNHRPNSSTDKTIQEMTTIIEEIEPVIPISESNELNTYSNVRKRRTSYNSKSLNETIIEENIGLQTSTPSNSVKSSFPKRRTLYDDRTIDETLIHAFTPPNLGNSTVTKVKDTEKVIHTILEEQEMELDTAINCDDILTPKQPATSLMQQFNNLNTFSSTKKPQTSKRRTLFNISMDIIDQRLENINKSAKLNRSNVQDKSVQHNTTTPQLETKSSNDKANNEQQRVLTPTTGADAKNTSIPKRRKLFAPTIFPLTPENTSPKQKEINIQNSNLTENEKKSEKKRSRTDDEEKQKMKRRRSEVSSSLKKSESILISKKSNRRSTMDFQTLKMQPPNTTTTTTNVIGQTLSNTQLKNTPFLVYTNMHTQQIDVIKEAVAILGGFQIEDKVSERTTHVVTLEVRRTINILRGIIRGLWILDYNWIVESMEQGKWLHEEQYETRNFSRAVEMCRAERQAFGPCYKIDLFTDCGPIYVSSKCKVPPNDIKELVILCSGRIVECKRQAKYIIGEICQKYPTEKICLDPLWILDSISINKLKKIHKYILKTINK